MARRPASLTRKFASRFRVEVGICDVSQGIVFRRVRIVDNERVGRLKKIDNDAFRGRRKEGELGGMLM
jgi:hypothetical protein